jgi:BlaI family penicillinase repressor
LPAPPPIGQAELEILRFIQQHQPVTVRHVADHVSATKGHVRTTVLNVMSRLVRKGYLVRRKQRGVYRYSARQPAEQLLRTLIRGFVDRALGGSPSPFVAYLAEDARLSDQDVARLKGLVQDLENRGRGQRTEKEER